MPLMPRSSALRRTIVGLLTAAIASAGLLVVGPAGPASAAPVPYAPKYHAGIDAYSSYESEGTCSIKPKPGVVAYRDLLVRTYGSRWSNISRACSASISGHEEGRSLDWSSLATNTKQKAQADALLKWLLATDIHGNKHAMARRLGIQYIQYNNKMWRAYNASAGWQPQMLGGKDCAKLGRNYLTACHRDHIHTSFSWAGAKKKTSYFTGWKPCPTPSTPTITPPEPANLTPVPVANARLLDTRFGANACRLPPKGYIDVKVTGVGGVPSTGVGAVALNITGISPTGAATYLSVYPAGTTWGGTSSVGVPVNGVAVGMVVVPVGSNGMVRIRSTAAPVDVAVDVVAYFATATSEAGEGYTPVPEQRVLDTRETTIMGSGERRVIPVVGQYGVPVSATGVLLNVTSIGSARTGHLTVSPTLPAAVTTATVNYVRGEAKANRAITQLAPDGTIELYTHVPGHVTIDIVGWFGTGGDGLNYNPLTPARVLDTRNGTGGLPTLVAGTPGVLTVAGTGGVPLDARAVIGTLTLVKPSASTTATVWAERRGLPPTTDLSVNQAAIRENLVAPELTDGMVALTVGTGSAPTVLDVLGYFR